MSALVQFVVRKHKGKWTVRSNELERSFSLQREAILTAVQLANESGKNGKPSVVLFQKSKDRFEPIWTYGQSPYPPTISDLLASVDRRNDFADTSDALEAAKQDTADSKVDRLAARAEPRSRL